MSQDQNRQNKANGKKENKHFDEVLKRMLTTTLPKKKKKARKKGKSTK